MHVYLYIQNGTLLVESIQISILLKLISIVEIELNLSLIHLCLESEIENSESADLLQHC